MQNSLKMKKLALLAYKAPVAYGLASLPVTVKDKD